MIVIEKILIIAAIAAAIFPLVYFLVSGRVFHNSSAARLIRSIGARYSAQKKTKTIAAEFPDAVTFMGNAVRAGLSLQQAIEMASKELAPPVSCEFERVIEAIKSGQTLDAAIDRFAESNPSDETQMFASSIEILRRCGGDLVENFFSIVRVIEARRKVSRKIRVLLTQGLVEAVSLTMMPWLLMLALYAISPEYIKPIYETRIGVIFLLIAAALETAGGIWIKKIVTIKV